MTQKSVWPSPSAWNHWTFPWQFRWPTGIRRKACWVTSMASRAMTSSSPMELSCPATWRRDVSSKRTASHVSNSHCQYSRQYKCVSFFSVALPRCISVFLWLVLWAQSTTKDYIRAERVSAWAEPNNVCYQYMCNEIVIKRYQNELSTGLYIYLLLKVSDTSNFE